MLVFPACGLCAAKFTAAPRIFIATFFFLGFGNHGRNGKPVSGRVHRNKCEIGGADVPVLIRPIVLDPNFNPDLHRGVKSAVYGGTQDNEISNLDRHQKIHMIHGSGDYILAAVAMGSEGTGHVDPVHEAAAKKRVERVGVVRENDLGHFGFRFANRSRRAIFRKVVVHNALVGKHRILPRAKTLKIAISKTMHSRVGVRIDPALPDAVKREFAVFRRRMRRLAYVVKRDLVHAGARNRKADCIPIALGWEVRTTGCITEIAIIVDGVVVGEEVLSASAA